MYAHVAMGNWYLYAKLHLEAANAFTHNAFKKCTIATDAIRSLSPLGLKLTTVHTRICTNYILCKITDYLNYPLPVIVSNA